MIFCPEDSSTPGLQQMLVVVYSLVLIICRTSSGWSSCEYIVMLSKQLSYLITESKQTAKTIDELKV